jgi:hypothetical protein
MSVQLCPLYLDEEFFDSASLIPLLSINDSNSSNLFCALQEKDKISHIILNTDYNQQYYDNYNQGYKPFVYIRAHRDCSKETTLAAISKVTKKMHNNQQLNNKSLSIQSSQSTQATGSISGSTTPSTESDGSTATIPANNLNKENQHAEFMYMPFTTLALTLKNNTSSQNNTNAQSKAGLNQRSQSMGILKRNNSSSAHAQPNLPKRKYNKIDSNQRSALEDISNKKSNTDNNHNSFAKSGRMKRAVSDGLSVLLRVTGQQ